MVSASPIGVGAEIFLFDCCTTIQRIVKLPCIHPGEYFNMPLCNSSNSFSGTLVQAVAPGSPAGGFLQPGDRLVAINGKPVRDELDLTFLSADEELLIEFIRDEKIFQEAVRKSFDAPLGIEIEPLCTRRCRNKCVFCFIDQNPRGLRKPLYVKDDDLRLSFIHGHYITLTSFTDDDFQRVIEQRLSPLYISVQATEPDLRARMLGLDPATAPDVMDSLRRLAHESIQFHTQIVFCPGWNDGEHLDRTLDDLESLGGSVLSVAVVPVGLSEHRDGLAQLEPVTPAIARRVIAQVAPRQARHLERLGERIVLLADEFYLLADEPLPDYSEWEIESQFENGVGMMADFFVDYEQAMQSFPAGFPVPRRVVILTSQMGRHAVESVAQELSGIEGLSVEVRVVQNTLYGSSVTVSGLLPGRDFDRALDDCGVADMVLIPANALREEDDLFLDDMTLDQLRQRHPDTRLEAVCARASAIVEIVRSI